jgi:hypothetical protein
LTHVCRRWHQIILDLSYQWTHIHVYHTRQPYVLQDILYRSKSGYLYLSLGLTSASFETLPSSDVSVFMDVLIDVKVHAYEAYALLTPIIPYSTVLELSFLNESRY